MRRLYVKHREAIVRIFTILLIIVVVLFCVWLVVEQLIAIYGEQDKKEKAMKEVTMKEHDWNLLSEEMQRQQQMDYLAGRAGVGADDASVLDDNVDAEDEPICQDLYDADGNLVWKGLSKNEAEQADEATLTKFNEAYEKYEESYSEATEDTKLDIDMATDVSDRLTMLCIEYDRSIPYAEEGFDYYKGYYKEESYDNTPYLKTGQKGFGMCGLGYVTWCYRNVLGYTPKALKGQKFNENLAESVNVGDIKIGDLCVLENDYGTKYGIVAGTYQKNHIVTMCDDIASENFPTGSNHVVYLRNETTNTIDGYNAVDFTEFYRLKELGGI